MKILFSLVLIICGITLFTFKSFESSLLDSGFSWTMSKLLPYLTLAIGGILLVYSFIKGFKIKSRIVKLVVGLVLFATPFAVGFVLHPIYQGDFSSEGTEVKESTVKVDEKYDLLIVTIPNCPYCLESITRLKLIKKRNPNIKMLFSVCAEEEQRLSLYRELIAGDFDIALAKDIEASVKLAEGHFPTFVKLKKGLPTYKWSNDQFGAGAIDELEGDLK
ncbi:hypothetical protein [Fluviicola taffensis]|uniref:hypothetical protein n=1 Tax=Fluviicola taffensis TaxID=191579 RepID=UPI003137B101